MMEIIGASEYLSLVRCGAARLGASRKEINDLNVFPIPDGDTGDNMYMTMEAGCNATGETLPEMAQSVSRGMLMGARGNSGVILSRIFAGLAKGLDGVSQAGAPEIEAAMKSAVEEAYGAVSNPVEGTILTVLREGAQAAAGSHSAGEYSDRIADAMAQSLEHTPELLDVLKKAGVVDSGGAGLLYIFEGMRDAIHGVAEEIALPETESRSGAPKVDLDAFTADSELEFGYCTEFLLRLQKSKVDLDSFDETVIRDWLQAHGESLVFFRDDTIIKVHVHTKTPGEILNHCQKYGEYLTLKIENMTLQHHENHMDERFRQRRKAYGVVAVASGEGLVSSFREMGADEVIEGGQTMNPPVQSFIEAFDRVGAETVFVLPDNSNILLTAQQAAEIYKDADIRVIPCKTLGEGYFALANLDLSAGSADEIEATLGEAIEGVVTGMVSRAIRTTDQVREGEYAGFTRKDILASGPTPEEAAEALCESLRAGNYDIILLLSGEGTDAAEAAALRENLSKRYTRSEVILQEGGQPVYDYVIILS
ncbi:MAG: DAK2 domain-containing protein [Bacteroidales bacterium]|nr:DAK2 domain-containing protein [Bacteroidales bacterium]